jgi:pyridoxal phosphate enzyme (YggS family)
MGDTGIRTVLRDNLARLAEGVAAAGARAGRAPGNVALVAVTKYVAPPVIAELLALGVDALGENRVQQLVPRAQAFGARLDGWRLSALPAGGGPAVDSGPPRPTWHMIGHLQRNKVRALLPHARCLHSLDSVRLATALGQAAAGLACDVDVLIEVNVAGEAQKTGAAPADVPAVLDAVRAGARLRLRGLMSMPPYEADPERARPHFAALREWLEHLRSRGAVGPECVHLSMGMSHDYAVAVEEGATIIRIGAALYAGLPAEHVVAVSREP